MKNRFLMIVAAALLSAQISLAAAEPQKTQEDTWFSMLVDGTRKALPPGAQMTTDTKLRFIIISMFLPVKSDKVPANAFQQQKPNMIEVLKKTPDADFIRKTGTTVIYNYISDDKVVYSVILSPKEL